MARTLPDGWEALEAAGAAPNEIATLRRLAAELPGDYAVFHGVHWTRIDHGYSVFGEIDFIVVGPAGQAVLIEQKTGALEETGEGLVKRYKDRIKVVSSQIQRSIDSLQTRFKQGHAGQKLALEYLLYCPDYRVQSPATAGIAPERIVDGRIADRLSAKVVALIDSQSGGGGVAADAVLAFFSDELQLVLDPSGLVGQAQALVTRLSGGLASWARRLEFEPFRLRVVGTAGSGKTQLALCVLRDAAAKGLRSHYVCFNRPLADRVAQLASPGTKVTTFHMLCGQRARADGVAVDFREQGVFERLAQTFIASEPRAEDVVDVLVVDEGQDFEQGWADALREYVRPGGSAWWLEDPMQNLYGRPPVALPGWVTLRADVNYRTPRDVLRHIGLFVDAAAGVQSGSPVEGDGIDVVTYTNFASLVDATKGAIGRALAAGLKRDEIVVLTFSGRERSELMPFDTLGGYSLRRFDGTYDEAGHPVFQEGDILIETVFRFKGQSAPCVILTEVDFDVLDERVARRLYVGATRATMQLALVVSERAAAKLIEKIG